LTNDKAQLEDKIAQLSEQMKAYEGQRVALDIDINQLDYRREEKLKKVEELTQKAKKQEEVELSLARRVTKRLLVNYEGSLLNHDWFAQKLGSLEEMEQQKKESLEEIQKEIWEKSIDQVLNQEDYFIPNKDVALIKDGIKGLGIYVETGSEYLRGLDELEKANLLQEHPGFLYSVVIKSKQDWDLIKKNIRADLFLNNMVPIYIRSAMQSRGNGAFESITGKAIELVNNNQFIAWKEAIEKNLQDLALGEKNLKNDLQDIGNLKEELKLIAKADTTWILNQMIKEEEKEIVQLADEIRVKKEEESSIRTLLNQGEASLLVSEERLSKIIDAIKQLQVYIEKLSEIEQARIAIGKVKQEQEQFQQDIVTRENIIENLQKSQKVVDKAVLEWELKARQIVESVKEVFDKARYPEEEPSSYINKNIPYLSIAADKLSGLVKTRKAVEFDIVSKNSSIAALETEIQYLNKDVEKCLKQMGEISSDWLEYPDLNLPKSEIKIKIDKKPPTGRGRWRGGACGAVTEGLECGCQSLKFVTQRL
jgi:chromosome segregation ATPase